MAGSVSGWVCVCGCVCVYVCVLFIYTISVTITVCVSQEEPSLINRHAFSLAQVNNFSKEKTWWKVNF